MYHIKILPLFLLIYLAFAYQLESQSLNYTNVTPIIKEELNKFQDNEYNYQPWQEWPNRLFPPYHTINKLNEQSWTIVTKSKKKISTELISFTNIQSSFASINCISSSKSQLTSEPPSSNPTIFDYTVKTSPTILSSNEEITETIKISSNNNNHQIYHPFLLNSVTPPITNYFDTSFTGHISPTPALPFSSISLISGDSLFNQINSHNLINVSDIKKIEFTPTFYSTYNLPKTTIYFNQTNKPNHLNHSYNDKDNQYLHKTVISLPISKMKDSSIDYENKLRKIFESAYLKLFHKNATDLQVQVNNFDLKASENSTILILVYSVQINKKYLKNDEMKKLLSEINDREMAIVLDGNRIISKAEPFIEEQIEQKTPSINETRQESNIKLGEILSKKILYFDEPYIFIFIGLVLIIILLCFFYLGMLICWFKHRRKKSRFNENVFKTKKNLNHLSSADSVHSSDTLNTENFIRWQSKARNSQKMNKRTKSLSKDDFKPGSLGKFTRRKEVGSSLSNEFEYISFSSDTTNSSLLRDFSLNKKSNMLRHHPFINQSHYQNFDQNIVNHKSTNKLKISHNDHQDYQQDYYTPTIEKIKNQSNETNSVKLLISRGIQNNLINPNDYTTSIQLSPANKFSLEIPSDNNHYGSFFFQDSSKEKLIPLKQYSFNNISMPINKNEYEVNLPKQADSKLEPEIESQTFSRSESRIGEPTKRLIKKEIIEEFETVTTTTTFKNNNQSDQNSITTDVNIKMKDAQLNEQTKFIINAIKDELKRFNQQPAHIRKFEKFNQ